MTHEITFNDSAHRYIVNDDPCDVGIYGVPTDMLATTAGGQREATYTIRTQPFGDRDPMTGRRWRDYLVFDYGDTEVMTGDAAITGRRQWGDVAAILARADRAVVIGGDDSINYYNAMALRAANPGRDIVMVHLDAHHDTNARGMGLPDHSTWVADVVADQAKSDPYVNQVVQVGVRAPGIADPQVRRTRAYDLEGAMRFARELPPSVVLWLAIDMDVIDPAFAPGVAVPEPFGLMPVDVLRVVQNLGGRAKMLSLTEVCPSRDVHEITSLTAHRIIEQYVYAGQPVRRKQRIDQRAAAMAL